MDQTDQLKKNCNELEQARDDTKALGENLRKREQSLVSGTANLEKQHNDYEKEKPKLYEKLALNQISQADFDDIRADAEIVSQKIKDNQDFLAGVRAALKNSEAALPVCDAKIYKAKNATWREIKNQEIAKVKTLLGSDASKNPLIRAYVAALQSGGASLPGHIPACLGYSLGTGDFSKVKKIMSGQHGLDD